MNRKFCGMQEVNTSEPLGVTGFSRIAVRALSAAFFAAWCRIQRRDAPLSPFLDSLLTRGSGYPPHNPG